MHIPRYYSNFPASMPLHIAPSLANLLWLVPPPAGARAGCHGRLPGPLTDALAQHLPGLSTASPFPDGGLDYFVALAEGPLSSVELAEATRVLAPGGTALLIGVARRRMGEARRLARTAQQAGLSAPRLYRVALSPTHPMAVVPDSAPALRAYARATQPPGIARALSRAAIRVGFLPPELTGLVLVGTRP